MNEPIQQIVLNILKEHPNLNTQQINFYAQHKIDEVNKQRLKKISSAVYQLSKKNKIIKTNKRGFSRNNKWSIP